MPRLVLVMTMALALSQSACTSQRSISAYASGYNPSYTGEMSQLAFIHAVSAPDVSIADPRFRIPRGARVMVMQSGQQQPDPYLLSALTPHCDVVGISGHPELGGAEIGSVRSSARAGDVDYVLGYWGSIRTDGDHRVVVQLSAVLARVATGTWRAIAVTTDPEAEASSFFRPRAADDRQVNDLKRRAYADLAAALLAQGR